MARSRSQPRTTDPAPRRRNRRPQPKRRRTLRAELLEDRRLLAGDLEVGWIDEFGTVGSQPSAEQAHAVQAEGSDIFVVGHTDGSLPSATGSGRQDAFVRRYDADQNILWTSQFGSSENESADGIAIVYEGTATDPSIFVVGYTDGELGGQTGVGARTTPMCVSWMPMGTSCGPASSARWKMTGPTRSRRMLREFTSQA